MTWASSSCRSGVGTGRDGDRRDGRMRGKYEAGDLHDHFVACDAAGGALPVVGATAAMSRLIAKVTEPSLDDPSWRAFCLAKETNSALAAERWDEYRRGLRQLEARHAAFVPRAAFKLALAEDAFFCSVHWKHSPRIVNLTLRELLSQRLGPRCFAFAAAEYLKWAAAVAPKYLEDAERLVRKARRELPGLDPLNGRNLEAMFSIVVGEGATSTNMKRRVLAKQRLEFRRPQTEEMLQGEFKIFAPVEDRHRAWSCEFEAPGLLEGRGRGYGAGPVNALMAASANLAYLLNKMVDVSTPLEAPSREVRRKSSAVTKPGSSR